ncbi:MAG TPA: hypothetical protein ENG63_10065 [Candidatus Desulfofervidus auxilii]|uniref:Uncharacterized protein n=1 Tax=Desulfofervidus auxilii TaxID=1621989 RepID=A0A7C0Y442_DESA2|nr:hypothetical protein [Candidatus Desulfofervidus auxilii]
MEKKDKQFLKWNNDNILGNLLQAEDHLTQAKGDYIPSEHIACVSKHLLIAQMESMEASKHCILAAPEKCDFYKNFGDKLRNLRYEIEEKGIVKPQELLHKIRSLRKEFEKNINKSYDTSQCKLGVCSLVEEIVKKGGEHMPEKEEKDVLGLGELVHFCWEAVRQKEKKLGASYSKYEKFKDVWECISTGQPPDDPISPLEIEELRAKCDLKPHPICLLRKVTEGIPIEEAEEQCLREGKVHPISLMACRLKVGK